MPKSTCLTCHRVIPMGSTYCTAHAPARKPSRAKPKSVARGFTYEYRKNRGHTLSVSTVCVLCGKPGANSADHILARDDGGDNSLFNLCPAHLSCNSSRQKRALSLEQRKRLEAYRHLLRGYMSHHGLFNT